MRRRNSQQEGSRRSIALPARLYAWAQARAAEPRFAGNVSAYLRALIARDLDGAPVLPAVSADSAGRTTGLLTKEKPMIATRKKLFPNDSVPPIGKARAVSFSLYRNHRTHLAAREKELNVQRSILVQLLIELDQREGILRQELLQRLPGGSAKLGTPVSSTPAAEGSAQ